MRCRVPRSVLAFLVVYMTTDRSSFLHHRRSFAIYSDMSPPSSSMTFSSLNNISRERKASNQYYYVKWGPNVWVTTKENAGFFARIMERVRNRCMVHFLWICTAWGREDIPLKDSSAIYVCRQKIWCYNLQNTWQ